MKEVLAQTAGDRYGRRFTRRVTPSTRFLTARLQLGEVHPAEMQSEIDFRVRKDAVEMLVTS